jgi:cell division protein FtsB
MSYEQYPFWLKNQRDNAEGEASYLRRENEQLKKRIKDLEKELKKLKTEG